VDVSTWSLDRIETIGADEKYWLFEPDSGRRWLFKPNTVHAHRGKTWTEHEDYSEKIAGELGVLLGVPCAEIELAQRGSKIGCVSLNLRPDRWELQTGAVLMDGLLDDYVPGNVLENKTRRGHSLENIRRALAGYAPPPNADLPQSFTAFDVFAGYVTFDAIIANRDRHDENWAVMRPPQGQGTDTLAGSFDHARALGSSAQESKLARIVALGSAGVEAWVTKGTAWRYEHEARQPIPTLVEMSRRALDLVAPGVRTYWLDRVASLTHEDVTRVTARIPKMSEVVSTFVEQVVITNRRRVLDDCG